MHSLRFPLVSIFKAILRDCYTGGEEENVLFVDKGAPFICSIFMGRHQTYYNIVRLCKSVCIGMRLDAKASIVDLCK